MEPIVPSSNPEDEIQKTLASLEPTKRQRILSKVIMAALGSVPWVGGVLTAAQAYGDEGSQLRKDLLQKQWLDEHREKFRRLTQDIAEILHRLDSVKEEIDDRLESEEYLALVRKAFRAWDQADTDQKRTYIKRLIANAGASKLCPDDLIRLFLDWLSLYHEAHFMVIREIYKNTGVTRADIWLSIHGEFPREDSAEADLFKLLIRDLSMGSVIRQHRETNYQGDFIKKTPARRSGSSTMKSAFDDGEQYELTELGKQFVHYVFTDIVQKIGPSA